MLLVRLGLEQHCTTLWNHAIRAGFDGMSRQGVGAVEDAEETENSTVKEEEEVLKHEKVKIPKVPGDDVLSSKVGRSLQRNV